MFTFQSQGRGHDLQLSNKKVVEFRNFTYSTDDEAVAKLIRERLGREIWEVSAILEQVKLDGQESEESEPAVQRPRRGRPPKNQIVQGMRTSTPIEEEGDSK
jgi:hypothetical protein